MLTMVGSLNRLCKEISTLKVSRTRARSWVISKECPPNSKKLSWMPIFSRPRSSCQISTSFSSIDVRGATYTASISGRVESGAGNAWRSILPLGVKGRVLSRMKVEGVAYSGS